MRMSACAVDRLVLNSAFDILTEVYLLVYNFISIEDLTRKSVYV